MNKKLTNFRESNRHPSQNDLPPIDKFHPDWWYYRQEMDEPDDEIDNIYKNESRNMNKKLIRLTESDLHKIVKESVNRIIKEEGYYDDRMRYENSYRECLRLLDKAKSAIITDYSRDTSYNETDPYYQDLDKRQWSVINKIDNAIDVCKKVALNGRGGTFDADNGYLSDPYFAGVNGG